MGELYMTYEMNKIKEANMIANGYMNAAKYLKKCEQENLSLMGIYASAYTTNLAFACELYFKQLLLLSGKNIDGHKLNELFSDLPDKLRVKVEKEYSAKVLSETSKRNVQPMSLNECLKEYNSAFCDWRYTFEGNKATNRIADLHFFILADVLKQVADDMIV